jgi:Ras-related protein Rab-8A
MKVVIIGDHTVGKSCLLSRLTTGQFGPEPIGMIFQTHTFTTAKGTATLQIWDNGGQERFQPLTPIYYRGALVVVMVFDLTRNQSFASLEDWDLDIDQKADNLVRRFVVGNKADLVGERAVEEGIARAFAEKIGATEYFETSAKSGQGVVELFTKVAETAQARAQVVFDSVPVAESGDSQSRC